jgi:hypothetical protein
MAAGVPVKLPDLLRWLVSIGANRHVPLVATAIVVAGFFCIHFYSPRLGFLGNIEWGKIYLTDDCPIPNPFAQYATEPLAPAPPLCGINFPYRFVLIAMIALVVANYILRSKADSKDRQL